MFYLVSKRFLEINSLSEDFFLINGLCNIFAMHMINLIITRLKGMNVRCLKVCLDSDIIIRNKRIDRPHMA